MSAIKKFYLMLITILLFIFIISGSALLIPADKYSYNREYLDKIELLKNEKGPRLILVGGSNVACGIDSYLIEENLEFKYNVINVGLHAGLGFLEMLKDVEEYVQPGDIVIAMPEYSHFYGDIAYGDSTFWDIVSIRGIKSSQNFEYFGIRVKSLGEYIISKGKGVLKRIIKPTDEILTNFAYDNRYFNEKGDFTGHYNFESFNYISPLIISGDINENTIELITALNENIVQKDANIIYLPPVLQQSSADLSKNQIEKLYETLKGYSFNFEVEPVTYFYSDDLFFDTPYHLNKEGVNLRSLQVVQDINNILKNKIN